MEAWEYSDIVSSRIGKPISGFERSLSDSMNRDDDQPWPEFYEPVTIKAKNLDYLRSVMGNDVIDRLLARPGSKVIS